MKAFFPARLAVILLFLLACATVLRGQKLGDNPAYYQLTARCSVNVPAQQTTPPNYVYGGSVVAFLWDEVAQANASGSIGGQALVGQATTFNGNAVTAHILPNKDYQGSITVMPWCTGTVSFVIPTFSGFVVYINGVPASSYSFYNTSNSNVNKTFTLRIALPNNYSADPEPTYLAAGASNSMVADKPILYFGLGRMRNSNPAGVVGFRAQDFSVTNLFTPGALYFSSYYPVPAGEVTMINVPSSNPAVLRQILSREVLVDINAINGTSYKLDFYPSSAVTGQPGGAGTVYTFSGSPFVSYTVAQNTASGISVTRTEDAVIWETDLLLSGTTWTFNDWHTQGTSLTSNRTTAYTSSTTATVTVNGPASGLGSTVPGYTDTALSWTKSYTTYPWGLELSQTNTGGLVSNYSYNSSTGLLQWATKRDGTWGAYTYYQGDATTYATVPSGYVQRMYHPWLDNTATDTTGTVAAAATTTNSAYDDYTYQYVAKGADTNGAGATASLFLPASTISYAPGGSMYKKTTWSYNTRATTINSRYVWSQTENDFWDSSSTDALVTTRLYYVPSAAPDLLDDQPVSTTYPSGRKDSYAYFSGTWNTATNSFAAGTGNDRLILCFQGQTTGGTAVNSWTNGSITWAMDSVSMVSGYSTVSETVIDTNGRAVFSGQDVYTAGTLVRGSGAASTYDSHGRLTDAVDIIRSIGANQYKTHRAYTALLLNSETSLDGVVTSYQYDDLLRQKQRTIGVSGLSNNNIYPARVISTTYDAASRPVATFTCGCGTAATVFWYDAAGRVIQQTDPSPNSSVPLFTNYTYSSLTSTTTTLPSGATKINTNYADGRTKSFTGRALPPIYYDYTVNGTGLQVTRYNSSSADQSQGWAIDQTDFLGRSVTHSSPTYNWATNASNIIDNHSTYDGTTGLLTKSSITYRATGGTMSPDHLYFYDGSGRLKQDGLDLNGDGVLTPASNDRYVSHDFSYSTDTWGLLSTSTTSTFPAGTALTVSKTVVRLTGFNGGVMGTNGLVVADTSVTDVNSQASSQVESVDSNTLRHHVDITISGVSQKGWSETINGYNAESVATSGARTKNEYDSLGRLVTVRSRWNATTSAYTVADAITFNSTNYSKLPDSQTINSVQTSLSYAWGTSGPSSTVTTTDAQNNSSYTLYNAMGLPSHIGGTAASPTQYDYDALGRLTSMTTWRNGPFTEASPWPAVSTGDTTTWTVESATGLGTKKTFADGNHVDFTYTPLGQPLVRTWARTLPSSSTRVTTTYAYYDGSTGTNTDVSYRTEELKSITYNDGTPTVSYSYQRSGLPDTITDAAGQRSLAYDPGQPLRVTSEALSSFYGVGGRLETQQYDAVYRPAGFTLSNAGNTANDLSQVMAYDPATGLPLTLTSTPTGQSARTFTYSFAPNTQLITGWSTGALSTAYSVIYGYETTTNRRNQVKNTMGGATIAEFDPTYDSRGQMQNIMQSGSAFADYFNTSYSSVLNAYSYDAMGELQASALYRGSTTLTNGVPASADELTGHKFLYSYDSMGNRLSAGESGTTNEKGGTDDSYTPNNLNQYTQRDNYTVRVVGTTATPPTGKSIYTAVAEAPSSKTNQVDRSWNADIVPGQGTNVATGTATVYAAIPGGGTGGQDIVRTNGSKSYTVPPTPQMYHYDFDGNLSDDGVWNYTYDAESRLIGMQNLATAIGSGKIAVANARKLVFTYDYLGRRIEKQVYGGWDVPSSTYSSTAILDHKFIYSGWNLVAEYNAIPTTLTLARSFTWGLDLGGSIANSGGVGALLQVTDHIAGQNYFPAYDQNGNVVALESDTGILAAGYEYSSFGDPMRADVFDSTVVDNPFRFSTKYTDLETGLVYYGMRYYGTKEGRFINRDPAQESGGANLYGIVGNNSVSNWDFLGLVEASNEVPVVMAPYVITCPIPHYSPPVGPTAQQLTDEHNKQTAIDDVNNSKKTDGGVGGQDGGSGNSGGGDATTTTTPDTPEKTPCEQAKENIRATREKMASLDQAEVAARNSLDIVQTKLDELSGKYAETVVSDCASLIEIPGGAEEYNEAINMAKTLTVNMPLDGKALYDAHKEHSTGDTMQAIASTIADVAVVTNVTLKTNANIHLPGASKIGPIATAVGIIGAIRNWAVYASNDSNYSFQVGDAKTKLNSVLNQEADLNDQYGQQLGAMSRICGDSK